MQRFNQTVRATFGKGLITEVSEMGFPEDASVDELNCDLTRKATRRRRKGVKLEQGDIPSSESYEEGVLFQTRAWENVGGDPDLQYLVVQIGNTLRFYEKGLEALSSGEVPTSAVDPTPYIINLSDFNSNTGIGSSSSKVECTSIQGYLVVASPQIDTFYITRNEDESFTTTKINFRVRDFEWLGDRLEYETASETATVSLARQYDTLNAGWFDQNGLNPLGAWIADQGTYPPLTHPWFSGKNNDGLHSPGGWLKVFSGTSLLGNGHYLLDLFNPDRDAASGLVGLPNSGPKGRFSTVEAFAGRVFFSGADSKVYFSRILEDISYIGGLHQVNDPTSEYSNDLLDTDGGFINIPEANGIKKLHVFGSSLLVFASNGVWRISGVDDVFRATEFSVSKITDFGLSVRNSFVAGGNNLPFWWSYNGIHSIVVTENGGFREVNISRPTIQTFWESIDGNAKSFVTGIYDKEDDRVFWAYPNNGESVDYKLNNFLMFDSTLQSFVPWKVSDKEANSPYIVGLSYFSGKRSTNQEFVVIDSDRNVVTDSDGNTVVTTLDVETISNNILKVIVRNNDGTLSFGTFSGTDFLDWGEADYSSYLVSSYNFIGDVSRFKTSPYITALLKVTETGVVDGVLTRPSSLFISAFWDFSKLPATSAQQGYRLKQIPYGDSETFTYPTSVVQTKLKLRGRGRVVSLRFEAETGKDFDLIGWETIDAVNSNF